MCKICDRKFADSNGFAMHNKSKHPELIPKVKKSLPVRNISYGLVIIAIIGLIFFGLSSIASDNSDGALNVKLPSDVSTNIPYGSVHWHPKVTIKIDGERSTISTDIGSRIGKLVDINLAGMKMAPVHTHGTDGVIHLENSNPRSKPETLTLGYFFYVWDKKFSSSCIFDYCTDSGELKMYVNGEENLEFGNYVMRDKDDILIEYTSNSGGLGTGNIEEEPTGEHGHVDEEPEEHGHDEE